MKISLRFLCGMLYAAFIAQAMANVATTAGSNLTAYNGTGSTNNNQWNNLMNPRAGMGTTQAEANFGNCNAIVLRCASPKCANGGCANMDIAWPIVSGCVNSNESCKKHGDDLIQYITAQIVAQSTAKQQEQANAVAIAQAQAEAQANAAAAAQNNAQMEQMQRKMDEMQAQMTESMDAMREQMANQSEAQSAQLQDALAARNSYDSSETTGNTGAVIAGLEGLGVAEQLAAKNGISTDILLREQMGGKIETQIEDAMLQMAELKKTLDDIIEYAGCDPSVTQCSGPKRVKKFKDMANQFFTPYEGVIDNIYDALILSMTLGIDVGDVLMLLSDSCNIWGKYMCDRCNKGETNCSCRDDNKPNTCYFRVATDGTGKVEKIQPHCRLVGTLNEKEDVYREWIDANSGSTGATQVACASDVINNYGIFRNRKKQATMDIDNLRRLVNQDSRACRGTMDKNSKEFVLDPADDIGKACWINRCAVEQGSDQYDVLAKAVDSGRLPTKKSRNRNDADVLCYIDENSLPDVNGTEVQEGKKCYSGYLLNAAGQCIKDDTFIGPQVPEDYFDDNGESGGTASTGMQIAANAVQQAFQCTKNNLYHQCKPLIDQGKCRWEGLIPTPGKCVNAN